MRRFLVSSFFADVTQHTHSLRASGVRLAHASVTITSDSIALRKSAGILCTVPEAIDCRAMVSRSLQFNQSCFDISYRSSTRWR